MLKRYKNIFYIIILKDISLINIEALIVAEVINSQKKDKIEIVWCNDWKGDGNVQLMDDNNKVLGERSNDISRYFARTSYIQFYGKYTLLHVCLCILIT